MRPAPAILAMCCLLLAHGLAGAAAVYRWVDDDGRVHYGEIVPERYRKTARPIDIRSGQPTPEQTKDALDRAHSDKARAAEIEAGRQRPAEPAAPASAASAPAAKRPSRVPDARTDCTTWQRLYQESLDCFGPYRTVRGGVKPEAFTVCQVVPEPPPERCRMRIP